MQCCWRDMLLLGARNGPAESSAKDHVPSEHTRKSHGQVSSGSKFQCHSAEFHFRPVEVSEAGDYRGIERRDLTRASRSKIQRMTPTRAHASATGLHGLLASLCSHNASHLKPRESSFAHLGKRHFTDSTAGPKRLPTHKPTSSQA